MAHSWARRLSRWPLTYGHKQETRLNPECDFLGVKTRRAFYAGMPVDGPPSRPATYPSFDEEYFEWVDILEAVDEAVDAFVMIELGAGFGRWCVRAATAARRKLNCQFHFAAVEPEPDHFRWISEHFRDNDIDPRQHDLIWAAVGAQSGFVPFWVGAADGWYGQAISDEPPPPPPDLSARRRLKARSILGRPPADSTKDRAVTWVPCVTLADVLAPYPKVDLIDVDIQGAEYEVLASAIRLLNERVRRLHIGTHSPEIEQQLRQLFSANRWENLNDYPCQSSATTPYGTILFGDGVQTWLNPALLPGAVSALGVSSNDNASPAQAAAVPLVERVFEEATLLRALNSEVRQLKKRNRELRIQNARLRKQREASEKKAQSVQQSRRWLARLVDRCTSGWRSRS